MRGAVASGHHLAKSTPRSINMSQFLATAEVVGWSWVTTFAHDGCGAPFALIAQSAAPGNTPYLGWRGQPWSGVANVNDRLLDWRQLRDEDSEVSPQLQSGGFVRAQPRRELPVPDCLDRLADRSG